MRIEIDARDPRPMYQQIVEQMKLLIASEILPEGAALPSVRQLAADLNVNLNTVATAYRSLQDEGLIAIRHGFGAQVAARRTNHVPAAGLRRKIRAVLSEMVLAGMPAAAILNTVQHELRHLRKGKK